MLNTILRIFFNFVVLPRLSRAANASRAGPQDARTAKIMSGDDDRRRANVQASAAED